MKTVKVMTLIAMIGILLMMVNIRISLETLAEEVKTPSRVTEVKYVLDIASYGQLNVVEDLAKIPNEYMDIRQRRSK